MDEKFTDRVMGVYSRLEQEHRAFRQQTGLGCPGGCGRCCEDDSIEATPLEFIPLAEHFYSQGVAMEWHEQLKNGSSPRCVMLQTRPDGTSACRIYPYRGLICRLFGFSARTGSHGQPQLVTCRTIKEAMPHLYGKAQALAASGHPVVLMNQYFLQMQGIDSGLTRQFFPVNQAILEALQAVLHARAYGSGEDAAG